MKLKTGALAGLTILVSIVVSLLILEIGIRIFVSRSQWDYHGATDNWQIDPLTGWVQKANLDIVEKTDYSLMVHFQTNADGLAPPTAGRIRVAGKQRIMIFGDSTVTGRAVPQDQTVTACLNRLLEKQGLNTEVINCGVEGYSTDQVLLRMEQLVPLYHPDLAFYCLCDNDFGGNVCSEVFGWPKPVFKLLPDGSLEMSPPDLHKRVHQGLEPVRYVQYSALYRFLQPAILVLRAKIGNWQDHNLLGLAPEMFYSTADMERIDWQLFRALLVRMKQVCAQNSAQFLLYTHPSLGEVWEPFIRGTEQAKGLNPGQYDRLALEKRLQQIAAAEKFAFIPLVPYFQAHQSEGPFHLLPRDPHCNPAGYRLTAEVLASQCSKLLSGAPTTKYRETSN
ncbi:MAG: GDSL-type esterase/lipase family protein [Deltaproteobacteria bacterium]|nr:GDSL-type esterase/lipase family protein [Deltaproteobacteria bacterium]